MEIDVKGLNELISGLKSPYKVQDRLKKASQRGFEIIATQLAVYPPPRHYKRTFKLKYGWLDAPAQLVFKPSGTWR